MAKDNNLSDFLKDVADAIRAKKGTTNLINPQNFSSEIASIETGGDVSGIVDGTITVVDASVLKGVSSIRNDIFKNLSIQTVVLPGNVRSVGDNAFANNQINSLTVENGVITIGDNAFANNQINSLTVPESVATIGDNAFANNELIELIMLSDIPPYVTDTTFPTSLVTTRVSYSGYENYLADENWQTYKDTLVRGSAIPSTITVTVNNYLGELVNGVVVTIEGNDQTFTGITGSNGVFVQGDLQPATYTISVAEINGFKTPEPQEVVVTENTQNNVSLTYLEKPAIVVSRVFAENSPSVISYVANEISSNNMTSAQVAETYGWNLGDKTSITLSTGEVIEMQIIGFNHDDKSDGSGKAGITLQMVNCLATLYNIAHSDKGGYSNAIIKKDTLPTTKLLLPQEWQGVIKLVDKKSANGGVSNYSQTLTLSEELFLLSEIEVFGNITYATAGYDEGFVYEYWNGKTPNDRIKRRDADGDGSVDSIVAWWLRSCSNSGANKFCLVNGDGNNGYAGCSFFDQRAISFAFCV